MTAHARLILHALAHLDGRTAVKIDARRVLLCLRAMSPAVVPNRSDLSGLAWRVVHAIAAGTAEGLDLPHEVAEHICRWCDAGARIRHRLYRRWLYRARTRDLSGAWGQN